MERRIEGTGQYKTPHSFDTLVEDIRERILEMLLNDEVVTDLVHDEVSQRFPKGVSDAEGHLDEVVCMCQLLVFQRVLKGVVS